MHTQTWNIAHRGASSLAPENTLAAFRQAVEVGADGFELDVQLSKDGALVVIHDEKVDRTTNGKGFVKDYTLEELKMLDAGTWYHRRYAHETIPTLDEVVQEFKGLDLTINVEIKSGLFLYPGIEKAVLDVITDHQLEDRVVISSFNHYSLVTCKELNPDVNVGTLYSAGLYQPWDYARTIGCYSIHPAFVGVKPEIIEGCHEHGLAILAWTVNDPAYMQQFLDAGIRGVITDKPQVLASLRAGGTGHEA